MERTTPYEFVKLSWKSIVEQDYGGFLYQAKEFLDCILSEGESVRFIFSWFPPFSEPGVEQ